MKRLCCLVCLVSICLQPLLTLGQTSGQERSVGVRVKVRDEKGNPQKDETLIYENSYALLIGNSKYQDRAWTDLPDVDEDIKAVKEVLEKQHGFKVEVAQNLNREAVLRMIDQFISKYGQRFNNRLLIYYSGHGYTALLPDERKMGYLVLPDAPAMPDEDEALKTPPKDEQFENFLPSAITMDDIESYARRITAKHVLFVFDSCFSGTVLYKDLSPPVPAWITTEELKPVRAYLTAGNETQRVPAFSKFRRNFVAGLMGEADKDGDGYILSSELGRWVSIEVEKDTGRKQTPVFGKSDPPFRRGDMVFISPKGISSLTNSLSVKNGEQAYWQFIEKSMKITDFENYLARCQSREFNCIYKAAAELKVKQLKAVDNKPKTVSWAEMPLVKGKIIRKPDTSVFGENYPDSIYLPNEIAGFRTAKKYKKLIMKVGVQDNGDAKGGKHFRVMNDNGILYEDDIRPNRRPIIVDIDISDSDIVGFINEDANGEPSDFIRYMDITFVVNPNPPLSLNNQVVSDVKGANWAEMPLVKGKVFPKLNTVVFGEKYKNSIYLSEEEATFRTSKKYKKLIMMVGVQDNGDARGHKHFWIKDENGTLSEGDVLPNRRPVLVEVDISDSDLISFSNYDANGDTSEFIRYINIIFVPK